MQYLSHGQDLNEVLQTETVFTNVSKARHATRKCLLDVSMGKKPVHLTRTTENLT